MRGPGPSRGQVRNKYGQGLTRYQTTQRDAFLVARIGICRGVFPLDVAARGAAAVRSDSARLFAGHDRLARLCFRRRHPRSIPGHARPHLAHSWFWIFAERHAAHRVEPSLFSIFAGSADSSALGAGVVVGRAHRAGIAARRGACSSSISCRDRGGRVSKSRARCLPSS